MSGNPMSPAQELLRASLRPPKFSRLAIGGILAELFDKNLLLQPGVFPQLARGRTLVVCGDFSGQHRGQHFETYSFLIFDLDKNVQWLRSQRQFRSQILKDRRRMSFKGMNDAKKRNALIPFLNAARQIEGCVVNFAILKNNTSLFNSDYIDSKNFELLSLWKPHIQERLLRIIHLSGFIVSGLSAPYQDMLWITDEDEISSNTLQLTQLTKIVGNIFSLYLPHPLRHIRCGTTKSDDGSLVLEDSTSIADFAAGTIAELCNGFIDQSRFPVRGMVLPLPSGLTWKCRVVSSWLAQLDGPLRQITCIMELEPNSSKTRTTILGWRAT